MTIKRQLSLKLDFHSGSPIYTQIVEQMRQRIVSGMLKPGDQLPTVRALAEELRVNFNTVARAYRLLDEAGVISTQQGRGTYIMEKPSPGVEKRLRQQALEDLARQYVGEAKRLEFPDAEISQMVAAQLKSWKEAHDKDTE